MKKAKNRQVDFEKKVSEKIQDAISKKDIFTRKDMNELESRIKTWKKKFRE